jgi:hypothetical protein
MKSQKAFISNSIINTKIHYLYHLFTYNDFILL